MKNNTQIPTDFDLCIFAKKNTANYFQNEIASPNTICIHNIMFGKRMEKLKKRRKKTK